MNGTVEAANKNVKKIIAKQQRHTEIDTKAAFRIIRLSDWGPDVNWGNPILTILWNVGCFAY